MPRPRLKNFGSLLLKLLLFESLRISLCPNFLFFLGDGSHHGSGACLQCKSAQACAAAANFVCALACDRFNHARLSSRALVPVQARPRAEHSLLALLGLVAVAGGLLYACSSSAAPASVLLEERQPSAKGSRAGGLVKELAHDELLLASLDGSSAPAPRESESPQQRKQRTMMMSKFGEVPASW